MKYQVGKIQDLKEDDPLFNSLFEAYGYAIEKTTVSVMMWNNTFWGVWTNQERGSELLAIVHNGDVFTK